MRRIKTGSQSFEAIRTGNYFYIDKTSLIREWWENKDPVTIITRARRFGKTLNMNMLCCFFSNKYAGRSDLFEGLDIWKDEKYRELQGTYPVIFLSFADTKETKFIEARRSMIRTLQACFEGYRDAWEQLDEKEQERYFFYDITPDSPDGDVSKSLQQYSAFLYSVYHKKVLILMDEYDTPLQEAYVNGYWDEMSAFIRSLFNATFKTNDSLERAIMTGITRVSKESIFSDLNNLKVVTTTSRNYETCFGFTQDEVDAALEEFHLSDQKEMVKKWYDGFTFGDVSNIYNPWSILQFLDNHGEYAPYWANTSGNKLISHELQVADNSIKIQMEDLLYGGTVKTVIDEQIIFSQLEENSEAIWSLFLASGYLKIVSRAFDGEEYQYVLSITNFEVTLMFRNLIGNWFGRAKSSYNAFVKALISRDSKLAEKNLNQVLRNTASFYDTSMKPTESGKSESFYHGLVLGMIVQEKEYRIISNRESGDGRYDVMMKPLEKNLPGIIIEFKVFDSDHEKTLEDTAERGLKQIEEKKYDTELISEGIAEDHIIHYGMGFRGKSVVIRNN